LLYGRTVLGSTAFNLISLFDTMKRTTQYFFVVSAVGSEPANE